MKKSLHETLLVSKHAISHILCQILHKDEYRNLLGCGTQSYELLTAAAAKLYDRPVDEIREHFIAGSAAFHCGSHTPEPEADRVPFDNLDFMLETIKTASVEGKMATAVLMLINLSRLAHETAIELMDSATDELGIITPETTWAPVARAETSAA